MGKSRNGKLVSDVLPYEEMKLRACSTAVIHSWRIWVILLDISTELMTVWKMNIIVMRRIA